MRPLLRVGFGCLLLVVLSLTGPLLASQNSRPFWTEKSSFIEGDTLYVVGVASRAATPEQGRQLAYEHGKREVSNFAQISDLSGFMIETQMTYEEPNSDGTFAVFRLLKVRLDDLTGWKKKLLTQGTTDLTGQVARLSQEIGSLKQQLAEPHSAPERQQIRVALTAAQRRYLAIQRYEAITKAPLSTPIKTLIEWLGEVIALDPTFADAWRTRGSWYQWQGDNKGAIEDYNEAIRHNPLDDNSWAHRGFSYAQLGKFDQAIADLNEAIRLNPSYVHLKDRMYIYETFGHLQEALADQEAILKMLPCARDEYQHRLAILDQLYVKKHDQREDADRLVAQMGSTAAVADALEANYDQACNSLVAGGLRDLLMH